MEKKEKDLLVLEQTEETVHQFRAVLDVSVPRRGWIHAIQRALGITNVQLAKRLQLKPQTIEDMQAYEEAGTIKLQTLRKLAHALGCELVYAIVPRQPLPQMRSDRARDVARKQLQRVSHSMRLEAQGVSKVKEEKELERLTEKLMFGNPKKLWE